MRCAVGGLLGWTSEQDNEFEQAVGFDIAGALRKAKAERNGELPGEEAGDPRTKTGMRQQSYIYLQARLLCIALFHRARYASLLRSAPSHRKSL